MPSTNDAVMHTAEPESRLQSLIDAFGATRVLVVGDLIADEFIYGEVARVSREAPVLILKYDTTEVVPGGAGNAASNVASLGARAVLAGMVGTDGEGKRLLAMFPRAVDTTQVVRAKHYRTPVKTRILAGGIHSAKQQVVRIDRETDWPLADDVSRHLRRSWRRHSANATRCCCPITAPVWSRRRSPRQSAARSMRGTRGVRHPDRVDSRYRLLDFQGPDRMHAERIGSRARARHPDRRRSRRCWNSGPDAASHAPACRRCSSPAAAGAWRCSSPKQPTIHVPIFGSDEVADVTGAGDTVIATLTHGAGGRRVVRRSGAPRQLRRRPRRDEARHRDRVGA